MTSMIDAALKYAAEGKPVFPCDPANKRPLVKGGFKAATVDAEQIRAWWGQWPAAMIGMPTGQATGFVVDLDGQEGLDNWAALVAANAGECGEYRSQVTPSGGRHLLYRIPPGQDIRNSTSQLAPKVDVRGTGGYIVVAPSVREDGRAYVWESDNEPGEAPGWLLEALKKKVKSEVPATAPTADSTTTTYGRKALELEVGSVATAPVGQRNGALNEAAFALGQLVAGSEVSEAEALDALHRAGKAADLPEGEVKKTVASGFKAGLKEPRNGRTAALGLLNDGKATLPPPVPVAGFTARELQGMDVAPPRWLVENLIPLGLFILAGPPKVGKSFLLLQTAHSVASGRKLLGNPTKKAGVVYLALEDGPSRLKKRMTDLFGGADAWPADLHIFPSWPRLGEGGLEELDRFLDTNSGVRLVIIDTWGRFRSTTRGKNLDAYQQDTMEVGTLQTWAKDREIALVLVTHLRKSNQHAETDPFDRITGSNGQFGVADAAALLSRKRGQDNGQLAIVGRDLEHDGEIPLIRKGAAWERADGMPRAHTDKQQIVLDYLIDHMHGAGPKEIAEATGLTERYVKQDALPSLMEQKMVRKDGRGAYLSTWLDDI